MTIVSVNEQYIRAGYTKSPLVIVHLPISEYSNNSSKYLTVTILVIIVGIIGVGLIFYSKKRPNNNIKQERL